MKARSLDSIDTTGAMVKGLTSEVDGRSTLIE
jgi:hypothetical protein